MTSSFGDWLHAVLLFGTIIIVGMVLASYVGLFDFAINQAQAASPSDTVATAITTGATGTSTMRS